MITGVIDETMSHDMHCVKPRPHGDGNYPWSIRTFLAFAAAGVILLDLVILRALGERRRKRMDRGLISIATCRS